MSLRYWLAVWRSGNVFSQLGINDVEPGLVLGWVTVCRRIYHLGM